MCKTFPFDDKVLQNTRVADIIKRRDVKFSSLTFFVDRFPVLAKCIEGSSMDAVEEEFLQYQVAELDENIIESERMDIAWFKVSEMKCPITGGPLFPHLAKIMIGIFTNFHSNTDCERIFSFVTKTKTNFRPNMKTSTLGAFVTHKVCMSSRGEKAHRANSSKNVLREAKSTTYNMLNQN